MNIYSNVDSRAEQSLATIANLFRVADEKTQKFSYVSRLNSESNRWKLEYLTQKSILSRVYKLKISYQFESVKEEEFHLIWQHRKSCWTEKGEQGSRVPASLNENKNLATELGGVDYEYVEIKKQGHLVTVLLIPIPGCFIWTLIPPMHYYVRIKPEEVASAKKVARMIQALLGDSPKLNII